MSKRVLIIGGVAGGASCAARLRRMDESAQIVLFERSGNVSFANCGLPYYIGGVIADRQKLLVSTAERFRGTMNVDVHIRHEAERIDRANRTVEVRDLETGDVRREPYDVLVLAPGAEPIRPKLPGVDLPGVFSLRNLDDTDAIHSWIASRGVARTVVIGGGFIGLEMVENLVHRNIAVTLLELSRQVMPPMDPEMVAPVHQELQYHGVHLQLNNGIAAIERGENETLAVVAQDGQRLDTDMVILAVGVRPDVKLARESGLTLGSTGGIAVDDQMRTSDPAIFAVGDAVEVRDFVTGQPTLTPLAGPANRQGRIAADAICGRDAHFRGTQGSAVVGIFDLTLALTGATEKSLRRAGIAYQKSYTHSMHHAAYYPGAKRISLKLLFSPTDGRILGAQAIGGEGVEKRIDVLAMAIQQESTVFDLEEAELCYAPQYGSAKDPVNIAGFAAANILRGDVSVGHWSEWRERQTGGDPIVTLDVRPPADVAAGAIDGTVRVPLGQLRERLDDLPRDREIWVHCNVGQTSYNAVRLLRQHGFHAKNLSGGITSYRMGGPDAG
jgi:NADPH-dependent 2,4-dienoyl-CoA reductase/sulfur reductase-like enzyme/rhodanese-related sulfurtransferase